MTPAVRVRFAPSPTGALHIGGLRTALYNYLWAKKHGGKFILRVEDTDQTRYVENAEQYITAALDWVGLPLDESPALGGNFAPYRQSERKAAGLYTKYVQQLIDSGHAYYAFDSSAALDALRKAAEAEKTSFKYDARTRINLDNSLTISAEECKKRLAEGADYVVRLKVEADETIAFDDEIRGHITYSSNDIDDKVLLKADGMPTYHLANVVDDYLMEISHVIRGEEWLPSTPTHVLLYRGFGWADKMPKFAHLPLILRPDGKGKLSKRDGAKFGIPVFPLDCEIFDGQLNFGAPLQTSSPEEAQKMEKEGRFMPIHGFSQWGFEPAAVLNFLALIGWSSPDGSEFFSLDELIQAFDIQGINKSGARFDFDKAKWFNQQYIIRQDNAILGEKIQDLVKRESGQDFSLDYCAAVAAMLKERVHFLTEFYKNGRYFFAPVDFELMLANEKADIDKKVAAKWDANRAAQIQALANNLAALPNFDAAACHDAVHAFMQENQLKMGELMPILRLALSGTFKGPEVFDMMALFGKTETAARIGLFVDFMAKYKG